MITMRQMEQMYLHYEVLLRKRLQSQGDISLHLLQRFLDLDMALLLVALRQR
jgi:hypothetical protein